MNSQPRSYLYVPANRPDRLGKALSTTAGAVIADLEDSVPATDKESARRNVSDWLTGGHAGESGPQRWVRVDPADAESDVRAAAGPALTGLVVAKADPAVLSGVDELLCSVERSLGLTERSVPVIALVESAAGLAAVARLATAPRVCRLLFGEVDLLADLGIDRVRADRAWVDQLRLQVVTASAAAGLAAPIGPTALTVSDRQEMLDGAQRLLWQGFRARTAIHPAQLPAIEQTFTPSPEEIAAAAELVGLFEAAGSGVAVDRQGRLLDPAVLRGARDVLARAPRDGGPR